WHPLVPGGAARPAGPAAGIPGPGLARFPRDAGAAGLPAGRPRATVAGGPASRAVEEAGAGGRAAPALLRFVRGAGPRRGAARGSVHPAQGPDAAEAAGAA